MSVRGKSAISGHFKKGALEEAECTFRPLLSNNPFISERTLRKLGHDVIRADANDIHHQTSSNMRRFHGHTPERSVIEGGNNGSSGKGKSKKSSSRNNNNSNNVVASLIMAGMYTTAEGLKRGPPERIGLPMYYFDPFSPPNFAAGTYGPPPPAGQQFPPEPELISEVPVRSENDHVQRPKELAAPALPPWASAGSGGTKAGGASNKIVIVKKDRSNEPAKAVAGGWQSIMAEMQRIAGKINGGGAAGIDAAKERERLAPGPKRKTLAAKKGPGKQSFKDPVEELKHKFAVLRGEVEPDEEEPPAPSDSPAAPTGAADEAGAATATATVTTPKAGRPPLKRMAGKPDLAAMLEKAKKGSTAAVDDTAAPTAAEERGETATEGAGEEVKPKKSNAAAALNAMFAARKEPPPAPAPVPVPVPAPSFPSEPAVISSGSKRPPMAPPVPRAWPPRPCQQTVTKGAGSAAGGEEKRATMLGRPLIGLKEVSLRSINLKSTATSPRAATGRPKELPEGYYMAAAQAIAVDPYEILAAGETSTELVRQLQQQFAVDKDLDEAVHSHDEQGLDDDSEEGESNEEDFWSRYHDQKSSFRRSNLNYSSTTNTGSNKKRLASADLPVPAGYAMTIERLRRSNEMRAERRRVSHQLGLRNWLDSDHLAVESTAIGTNANSSHRLSSGHMGNHGTGNNISLDLSHLLLTHNNSNHGGGMSARSSSGGVSQVGQRLHGAATTSWATKSNASTGRRAPPPPPPPSIAASANATNAKQQAAAVPVEWDGLDLKGQKWMTSLRSPSAPPPPPSALPAAIDRNHGGGGDPAVDLLQQQQQVWQVTIPVEPIFRADEIIHRRQRDRAERQRLEAGWAEQRLQMEKDEQRRKIAMAAAGNHGHSHSHSHHAAAVEEKQETSKGSSSTRSKRYSKLLQQYSHSLPEQVRSSLKQMIPSSPSNDHHGHSTQQRCLLLPPNQDESEEAHEQGNEDEEEGSTSSGGSSLQQQQQPQPAPLRSSYSSSATIARQNAIKPAMAPPLQAQQQYAPDMSSQQQLQDRQQLQRSASPSCSSENENSNRRPPSPSYYSYGYGNSNYSIMTDKRAHSRYYEQRMPPEHMGRGSTSPRSMSSRTRMTVDIDELLLEEYM